jgi:hypothetical protein
VEVAGVEEAVTRARAPARAALVVTLEHVVTVALVTSEAGIEAVLVTMKAGIEAVR